MNLDAFGLTGAQLAKGAAVEAYHGPWPRLDRHGNVYWWRCLEPGCPFRTDPESHGGTLWWTQKQAHAAAHPGRDPSTIGHPTSLGGCHLGGPPERYLRDEGRVYKVPPADDEP